MSLKTFIKPFPIKFYNWNVSMHSASSSVCKKKWILFKKCIYINHKGIKRKKSKIINTTKNTLKDIKNLLGTY